jgi:hypothetical protein
MVTYHTEGWFTCDLCLFCTYTSSAAMDMLRLYITSEVVPQNKLSQWDFGDGEMCSPRADGYCTTGFCFCLEIKPESRQMWSLCVPPSREAQLGCMWSEDLLEQMGGGEY